MSTGDKRAGVVRADTYLEEERERETGDKVSKDIHV